MTFGFVAEKSQKCWEGEGQISSIARCHVFELLTGLTRPSTLCVASLLVLSYNRKHKFKKRGCRFYILTTWKLKNLTEIKEELL